MKTIKIVASLITWVGAATLGAITWNLPVFMGGVALALILSWLIQCLTYVQELTIVPVYDRLKGITVRLLEPGLQQILFPLEMTLVPISTRITITEYIINGRSADGVPVVFHVTIWYMLAPQNIPLDFMPATIDQYINQTNKVLNNLVGIALRRLIIQKPAAAMMKSEGYEISNRYFRAYLRSEAEGEGFIIHRALVEQLEVPSEMQSVLNQAAGTEAEVGAMVEAGKQFGHMADSHSPEELEMIRQMELIRSARKGNTINVVSTNHAPWITPGWAALRSNVYDTSLDDALSRPLPAGDSSHTAGISSSPRVQSPR